MQTIFDVGMYNGADTAYYIDLGFRVIAVEANPTWIERARVRFSRHIEAGTLVLVHAAITPDGKPVHLFVSGDDPGSSSVLSEWVAPIQPIGSYAVDGIRFATLLERYGVPHFLKVDIEGSDRECILALTQATCPRFLSFEIGPDFEELLTHVRTLGFQRFKIVDQGCFRNLAAPRPVMDRITTRLVRYLGYADPRSVRRAGRFFASGSSGPVPWQSDGAWTTADAILALWRSRSAAGLTPNWYDVHAAQAR